MSAENPGPDNDTMESLIDTNEQLQQALNHHHRAVLQARKHLGVGDSRSSTSSPAPQSQQQPPARQSGPPPQVPRKGVAGSSSSNGKGKSNVDVLRSSAIAGPSRSGSATPRHDTDLDDDGQDPFRDPEPAGSSSRAAGNISDSPPRLSYEPFHPGFGESSSSATAGGEKGRREPVTSVSDDEEDVYRATPKKEGRDNRF
jgi:hypothetical protein